VDDHRLEPLLGWLRPGSPDQGDGVQAANKSRADDERGRIGLSVTRAIQRYPVQSLSKAALRFHHT